MKLSKPTPTEETRNATKRVVRFEVISKKPDDPSWRSPRRRAFARWDKKRGLLVRVRLGPEYGVDSLEDYWKATEASPGAIVGAIREVGKFLESGTMDFDSATSLLDLLNQALARKLPP